MRARGLAHETGALLGALSQGPAAVGREAIRATRMSRQTVRGKEGGVYYVLAPGPSALLAPLLRVDRTLNRAAGTPGRLAVTLLAWNALSALLVVGLMLLVRDLTGRPGLAAAAAAGFAFLPPFYFYAYQFYPEMLGALALVFLFRALLDSTGWSPGRALPFGLLLATLPWLHQKFLPVWAVLSIWTAVRCVRERTSRRALLALALPQVASGALFALYNFSITGSIRPDALFLAWGPAGVKAASTVWGVPGLLFDARYGLMPYAPLYLAAGAGILAASEAGRRLRLALPAVAVYFLTVASADNWSGAGCNLGRYLMPITPVLVALVAVGAEGITLRPGAMGLFATLAAWSGVMAVLLGLDPHAANDCSRLLARSVFADGEAYIPTLPLRDWAEAAPGLWMRVAVWIGFAAAAAWALHPRRPGRDAPPYARGPRRPPPHRGAGAGAPLAVRSPRPPVSGRPRGRPRADRLRASGRAGGVRPPRRRAGRRHPARPPERSGHPRAPRGRRRSPSPGRPGGVPAPVEWHQGSPGAREHARAPRPAW